MLSACPLSKLGVLVYFIIFCGLDVAAVSTGSISAGSVTTRETISYGTTTMIKDGIFQKQSGNSMRVNKKWAPHFLKVLLQILA